MKILATSGRDLGSAVLSFLWAQGPLSKQEREHIGWERFLFLSNDFSETYFVSGKSLKNLVTQPWGYSSVVWDWPLTDEPPNTPQKTKRAGDGTQLVDCVPTTQKALGSISRAV